MSEFEWIRKGCRIEDARGRVVAKVSVEWIDNDELERRGRCLAAAPELLEVVRQYVILGKGRCTIGKPLLDMAVAALQKAEGGQAREG